MTSQLAPSEDPQTSLPLGAVSELAAAGERPTSAGPRHRRIARFQRFCAANGYSPLPADEQHVLRWFHLNPSWSYRTMIGEIDAIRWAHVQAGMADPTLGKVKQYRDAVYADKGKPPDHISPLLPHDISGIDHSAGMAEPILRAAVAADLARLEQADLRRLAGISRDELAGIAAALPDGVERDGIVEAGTARLKSNIHRLLDGSQCPFPLAAGQRPRARRVAVAESLARMAERAGLSDRYRLDPWPGAGLSSEDHDWWVAWADPRLAQRVRDSAYIWTGLSTGYRHQNLRCLLDIDTVEEPDRYHLTLWRNKTPVPAEGLHNFIEHLHDDTDRSQADCPACELRNWIRFRQRAGITDPVVFCRLVGGPGPLSVQNAGLIVKRFAALAGIDPERVVATRALRVGTVTAMSANGASLPEIAEVTHHISYSVLAGYVRQLDPVSHQYHLPL